MVQKHAGYPWPSSCYPPPPPFGGAVGVGGTRFQDRGQRLSIRLRRARTKARAGTNRPLGWLSVTRGSWPAPRCAWLKSLIELRALAASMLPLKALCALLVNGVVPNTPKHGLARFFLGSDFDVVPTAITPPANVGEAGGREGTRCKANSGQGRRWDTIITM